MYFGAWRERNTLFYSYFDGQFINLYLIINISPKILILLIQLVNQKLTNLANYISPNI